MPAAPTVEPKPWSPLVLRLVGSADRPNLDGPPPQSVDDLPEPRCWELADPAAEPGSAPAATAVTCEIADGVVAFLDIAAPKEDASALGRMVWEIVTMLRASAAQVLLAVPGEGSGSHAQQLALSASGFRRLHRPRKQAAATSSLPEYLILRL